MFIGHFALGFAAKRAAPRLSLAVLFAAAQLADLLWPVFVALGLEHVRIEPGSTVFTPLDFVSYPYSHSLLMLIVWGSVLGWVVARRDRRACLLVFALVVSHWVLDVVTHKPDMPIYPGGPKLGMRLWNHPRATMLIELAMYGGAIAMYVRATRPRDAIGRWAFVALAVIMLASYVMSVLSPSPPPSVGAIVIVGLVGGALLLVLAWWADAHRETQN